MANQKPRRKSSLSFGEKMIFIAGILLCLVLITTAMMGGLFARYVSTGTGSDSARVAKFGNLTLTETGDFDGKAGIIIPGVDLKKEVRVSFSGSEMATYVFVEVMAHGWPIIDERIFRFGSEDDVYLSWSVEENWERVPGTRSVYFMEVPPNTQLTEVNFIAPLTENGETHIRVGEAMTKADLSVFEKTTDLTITLQASVIQAGGFQTVEEAWAALSAK